jgi:thioredoxin 1
MGRGDPMKKSTSVVDVDDATFDKEVLAAELPVLVEVGAAWCAPCRAMAPVVERLAAENEGRIKVVAMDMEESPVTSARYGIRGVPTVLVFRGGEKTAQHLGATTKEKLMALVTR